MNYAPGDKLNIADAVGHSLRTIEFNNHGTDPLIETNELVNGVYFIHFIQMVAPLLKNLLYFTKIQTLNVESLYFRSISKFLPDWNFSD